MWTEINLDHIVYNLGEAKRLAGNQTKILAVIKANAYGHRSLKVARTLLECGVERLAVATLDEALQLRLNGCTASIQILGHTFSEKAEEMAGWAGTIAYEVVCRIGMRVPRVYIRHGNVIEVDNYLDMCH